MGTNKSKSKASTQIPSETDLMNKNKGLSYNKSKENYNTTII